ncbi:MAG TPA: zinc-ribbon domain-containing protein [Anaerolineales bacterium]|nr:zinc-ribbon domain-containing protein [Anaerolineae bacterium]HIQ01359.1 zinc-ribbon domain-containing protein [Anaerolineales bacterium]
MEMIQFVHNYNDESTDRGFQFEFYCDRCGTGYRTPFKPSVTGIATEVLDTASGLLGGLLGTVTEVGDRVHSAAWERAHDAAFAEAVERVKPHFRQCPRCTQWVCVERCWNQTRGLCKECAPDVAVEMSAMQAEAAIEGAREVAHAAKSEEVTAEAFDEVIRAVCPKCGAPVSGGKFCAECGAPLTAEKFCAECGKKIPVRAKFCPECGVRQV